VADLITGVDTSSLTSCLTLCTSIADIILATSTAAVIRNPYEQQLPKDGRVYTASDYWLNAELLLRCIQLDR
jgi:hypothetical protein